MKIIVNAAGGIIALEPEPCDGPDAASRHFTDDLAQPARHIRPAQPTPTGTGQPD